MRPFAVIGIGLISTIALTLIGESGENLTVQAAEPVEHPYGVTRQGKVLRSYADSDYFTAPAERPRFLVIGGLDGTKRSRDQVLKLAKSQALRAAGSLAWIPEANPEGLEANESPKNSVGGSPLRGYPPKAKAYDDPENPEAIYLWRWIGMLAPDEVIIIESGKQTSVRTVVDKPRFELRDVPRMNVAADELTPALCKESVAGMGAIPTGTLVLDPTTEAEPLVASWLSRPALGTSPARRELQRRLSRTSIQIADELSAVYGHQLNEVAYIPALALVGRLRLGELQNEAKHQADVLRIVKPYHSAEKNPLAKNVSGSTLSGHLVFGELADRTRDARYVELAKAAADLGFDKEGKPLAAMPYHAEMSDAVFMGTPILALAGRLTNDPKYVDMALRHVRFMTKTNQRPDKLHQHSPIDPDRSAWGRGNGFVTLGLILTLSELPADSAAHREIKSLFIEHLHAMQPHQDALGMWHQVVDRPESYREFTVTCMTTFAIARGLRHGWLDRATYEPIVRRAWPSLQARIGAQGQLVDVCTGTGKMKSLREYFDRPANFGKDDRGGAMALMVCTELALAEREHKLMLMTK